MHAVTDERALTLHFSLMEDQRCALKRTHILQGYLAQLLFEPPNPHRKHAVSATANMSRR